MKFKSIIPLLIAVLTISGCNSDTNSGNPLPVVTTNNTVAATSVAEAVTSFSKEMTTDELDSEPISASVSVADVQNCISFDSRNELANDGYSDETIQQIQYQIGTFNFIPVTFNGEYLSSESYDEFCSLIRSSTQLTRDSEFESDNGTFITKFNIDGGARVMFYDKEPVSVIADAGALTPIQFQIMGISLGDTLDDVNRLVGTKYVEYPTLRTLVIRDADSSGYVQFSLDENLKIYRMEFKFGADD